MTVYINYATLADKHYNLNNHCFHFAIYLPLRFWQSSGIKHANNVLYTHLDFYFPHFPKSSFFTSILNCCRPLQPSQWRSSDLDREIYRQLRKKACGMLCTAFTDKKGLMPVWRPPPGLPECEWTLVNKMQTYTDTPAAIGPPGGKSVWATSNNNNNKASCMPGFLFFTPLPITRRRCHRRGAWEDGSLTKKKCLSGGHCWLRLGLSGCEWGTICN